MPVTIKNTAALDVDIVATVFENPNEDITADELQALLRNINASFINRVSDKVYLNLQEFSTARPYDVGECCVRSTNIYQCIVAHTAGAWNASHFELLTDPGIGGSLTATRVPYFDGTQFVDTNIQWQTLTLNINSPTGNAFIALPDDDIILAADVHISISSADLIVSRALAINSSGYLVSANTTLAELNFVSGVTSAIQPQIAAITSQLPGFLKADGSVQLSNDWNAGPFKITAGPVTIGDELTAFIVNSAINGGEINALGDGLIINANGRAMVLNSDTAALDIIAGFFRYNDPNKGVGKTLISDVDGIMAMQYPAMYPIPKFTYANITAGSSFANIANSKIPARTMNDGDCMELVFIGDVQSGSSANIGYGFSINGVSIITSTMAPDGGGPKTACVRVFARRVGNYLYVAGEFNFGSWGNVNVLFAEDTSHTYDFTTDINISFIGNPGGGGRTVSGLSATGYIIKGS